MLLLELKTLNSGPFPLQAVGHRCFMGALGNAPFRACALQLVHEERSPSLSKCGCDMWPIVDRVSEALIKSYSSDVCNSSIPTNWRQNTLASAGPQLSWQIGLPPMWARPSQGPEPPVTHGTPLALQFSPLYETKRGAKVLHSRGPVTKSVLRLLFPPRLLSLLSRKIEHLDSVLLNMNKSQPTVDAQTFWQAAALAV